MFRRYCKEVLIPVTLAVTGIIISTPPLVYAVINVADYFDRQCDGSIDGELHDK